MELIKHLPITYNIYINIFFFIIIIFDLYNDYPLLSLIMPKIKRPITQVKIENLEEGRKNKRLEIENDNNKTFKAIEALREETVKRDQILMEFLKDYMKSTGQNFIHESKIEISKLTKQLEESQNNEESLKEIIKNENKQITELKSKLAELRMEKIKYDTVEIRLSTYKKEAKDRENSLKTRINELEKQLQETHAHESQNQKESKEAIENLENQLEKIQKEKEELKDQLNEYKKREQQANQEKEEEEKQKTTRTRSSEDLKSNVKRVEQQIVNLNLMLEQSNIEIEAKENEINAMKDQIEKLKQQVEQAQTKKSENSINKSNGEEKFIFIRSVASSLSLYPFIVSKYQQYHYNTSTNVSIGSRTPTILLTRQRRTPVKWDNILEIRYATLSDFTVTLIRNDDTSCYIDFIYKSNDDANEQIKRAIVLGQEEQVINNNINSFLVYKVCQDLESFTDDVPRLIYISRKGLYIVQEEKNSIDEVCNKYQSTGIFVFNGPVLKVSAIDGTVKLDNQLLTGKNFYDHGTMIENFNKYHTLDLDLTGPPPRKHKPRKYEILNNFINYFDNEDRLFTSYDNQCNEYEYNNRIDIGTFVCENLSLNRFKQKIKSRSGCEEIIRDGTYAKLLASEVHQIEGGKNSKSSKKNVLSLLLEIDRESGNSVNLKERIINEIKERGVEGIYTFYKIPEKNFEKEMNKKNFRIIDETIIHHFLFKDPDFWRPLKKPLQNLSHIRRIYTKERIDLFKLFENL